jgi:hypothetical protein
MFGGGARLGERGCVGRRRAGRGTGISRWAKARDALAARKIWHTAHRRCDYEYYLRSDLKIRQIVSIRPQAVPGAVLLVG